MRTSPSARLALLLAAVLALATSFGLHPEPAGSFGPPSGAAAWAKARGPEAVHGCLACLAHGTALASPSAGIVLEAALCESLSLSLDSLSHGLPAGDDRSGRSPPFERS